MANVNKTGQAYPTSVGVAPFMGWLPRKMWSRAKEFFTYSVEFLPVAAGATATDETAIQADSDFVSVYWARVVTDTTNLIFTANANAPLLVNVIDTGSGRQVFDRPQHIDNLWGTGQLPSYLPMPAKFRASGAIQTVVQNLDGANAFNVRISYVGFKVFGYPAR